MNAPTTLPVLLVLAACAAHVGCAARSPGEGSPLGAGVLETLRTRGAVDVIVSLTPPPGYDESPRSPAVLEAIARVQAQLLARLDSADFRLRHRFTSVPALTGTVYTEGGLRALGSDTRVVRIDLDAGGGTGGGSEPSEGP